VIIGGFGACPERRPEVGRPRVVCRRVVVKLGSVSIGQRLDGFEFDNDLLVDEACPERRPKVGRPGVGRPTTLVSITQRARPFLSPIPAQGHR
jgi:hypothetical protein